LALKIFMNRVRHWQSCDYGNFYVINNCIFSIDVEIVNYSSFAAL